MKSLCGFPFKLSTGSISNEINHASYNVISKTQCCKVLELLSLFCAVAFVLASNPSETSSEARWSKTTSGTAQNTSIYRTDFVP